MTLADRILQSFPPQGEPVASLTLVEDPDCVMADESLYGAIASREYTVSVFDDACALRWIYEWRVRGNDSAREVVIFRRGEDVAKIVPQDILISPGTRRIGGLTLGTLFPDLDRSVLMELGKEELSDLYLIRDEAASRGCTEFDTEKTCEFVFEDLWQISATAINTRERLFATLVEVHVLKAVRSKTLLKYFSGKIAAKNAFRDWPQREVVCNEEKFCDWAAKAWRGHWGTGEAFDAGLDFENHEVRNAFSALVDADVAAVEGSPDQIDAQFKYLAKIRGGGDGVLDGALDGALEELRKTAPKSASTWIEWCAFAKRWAAFEATKDSLSIEVADFETAWSEIDREFSGWLDWNYRHLANVPSATPPVAWRTIETLDSVRKADGLRKIALVVMDGMAWKDWVLARRKLEKRFSLDIAGMIAAIPTVTSVSRQAIFSGKTPADFADSISGTSKEPTLWRQAWEMRGVDRAKVKYKKGLGLGKKAKADVQEFYTNCEVLGLVVDAVDELTHGTLTGSVEMAKRVSDWMDDGYLGDLLAYLVEELGFAVFMTSDHGNVEAVGTGNLNEGQIVETRGERVRVYPNETLRNAAVGKLPEGDASEWSPEHLPDGWHPLFKAGRGAFTAKGEKTMAHGGISIEETIVPFVRIRRKV